MIEARDLSWEDTFFDGEPVVAVFDFDYGLMESFETQVGIVRQGSTMALMSVYGLILHPIAVGAVWGVYALSLAPCLLQYQIQWEVRAQHVAVTQDGIRFVQDKRKSICGWGMCDKGKHSKTVPFDKITDCDIVEPAGNECICIPRVLMKVIVDTASSSGTKHDLAISGLKDPHAFKQLVWAMKRARRTADTSVPPATSSMLMERGTTTSSQQQGSSSADAAGVATLLQEIRDELRANNTLLRNMQDTKLDEETTQAVVASASATAAATAAEDSLREVV